MTLQSFNLNDSANLIFKVENKAYKLTVNIEQGYLHLFELKPQPYGQYDEDLKHVYDLIPFPKAKQPIKTSENTEPSKDEPAKLKPKKRKKK